MENNNAVNKHCCNFCNYATKRKYDLIRHHNAKHLNNIMYTTDDIVREKMLS